MSFPKSFLGRLKRGPADVVGVHVDELTTYIVRMRKDGDSAQVIAARALPPVTPPHHLQADEQEEEADESAAPVLEIPPEAKARYVTLTVPGGNAVVKLLSLPGAFTEGAEEKLIAGIGLRDEDEFRIGYTVVSSGQARGESRVLVAALPEEDTTLLHALFSTGTPAPWALEIAGLSALSAFLAGPGAEAGDEAVGIVDFGESVTTLAFFHETTLALVRRFSFGTREMLDKIQESLGVDGETAAGILSDGSFDVSQSVNEVMRPLARQLVVSRDFVERRENCRISRVYVGGGLVASHDVMDGIGTALGVETVTWNPFDGFRTIEGAVPEEYAGRESCFAAAVGAAAATLEEA